MTCAQAKPLKRSCLVHVLFSISSHSRQDYGVNFMNNYWIVKVFVMAARFFLLFVLPSLVFSQYCANLDIFTISNNSPLCWSLSGEFAFEFYPLGNDQSLFLLAILLKKKHWFGMQMERARLQKGPKLNINWPIHNIELGWVWSPLCGSSNKFIGLPNMKGHVYRETKLGFISQRISYQSYYIIPSRKVVFF